MTMMRQRLRPALRIRAPLTFGRPVRPLVLFVPFRTRPAG